MNTCSGWFLGGLTSLVCAPLGPAVIGGDGKWAGMTFFFFFEFFLNGRSRWNLCLSLRSGGKGLSDDLVVRSASSDEKNGGIESDFCLGLLFCVLAETKNPERVASRRSTWLHESKTGNCFKPRSVCVCAERKPIRRKPASSTYPW